MGESLDEKSDSSAGVNRPAASTRQIRPVYMMINLDGLGAGVLIAADDRLGAGVLRSMTSLPSAGAERGISVWIVTSCDGFGIGVSRSMMPPAALAGLFSEDGKAKLRSSGDKDLAVKSDCVLGVKYSSPRSAASRRSPASRCATHRS